jgi:hypothetical protein
VAVGHRTRSLTHSLSPDQVHPPHEGRKQKGKEQEKVSSEGHTSRQ